jgi:predicted DNA-binding transcriptional regulator AlpA
VAATKHQASVEEAKLHCPSRPCYLHLSAHKLRALVKSKKTLSPEHLAALDEAWFHTFGVLLILQDCESVETQETMLGVEQVLRMSNLSLTSLKRHVLAGKFPRPHRSSSDRIGWRAGDVSAWLHQTG